MWKHQQLTLKAAAAFSLAACVAMTVHESLHSFNCLPLDKPPDRFALHLCLVQALLDRLIVSFQCNLMMRLNT